MANIDWNIKEAQWIHKHTGVYPALNCFDFLHMDRDTNYTNIAPVQDWWNANGLVSIMWHWNVPVSEGSKKRLFYLSYKDKDGKTIPNTFDIRKAIQPGTYEHGIIMADLEEVAGYLLLLKEQNIPVIWRPLHEASGAWFWWGTKGPEPLKALWRLMFELFEEKGLNNLIWAWTSETKDAAWYPGDRYVDIIGRDLYKKNASIAKKDYDWLKKNHPNKLIALSECGNVASISDQWKAGATWSWFMPWYDYYRTKSVDDAFDQTIHQFAGIDFWKSAFADPLVITLGDMPDLK